MKKIYFLFLLALLPIAVYADAVEIDGIYYDLNAENNTAEVKSNPNKYSGSVVIPSKVTYENNTYDVTSIGDIAFYECTELISISIPNGITSIGFNAFYRCYKLSSINIPNTVTKIWAEAFWWCGELTSVTIPNGITTIEPDVFRDSGLNSIEIPSSVTYISSDAFNDSFLTSVTIPNSVTGIGEKAFYKCDKMEDIYSYIQEPFAVNENVFPTNNGSTILHVPAGTKSAYLNTAGWSKFGESNIVEFTISSGQVDGIYYQFSESEASVNSNPQKYTGSVTIPSSVKHQGKTYNVTSISDNAFESCSGLTSVVIPNSVTSIGKEAFEGCSSLAEINIPDGVTSIAHQTFKNCNSLTAIVIPENVTGIAYEAFKGCSELTAITIPNSVRGIGKEAFEGCSSLAEINIPTGITSIGDQTFHDCSSLTAITIPDGVTSIGEEAFKGCLSLTSITIPKSVSYIRKCAFNQCPGLISLNVEFGNTKYDSRGNCNAIINTETNSLIFGTKNTIIPHDVSSIGDYAFYDCTSLTSITIPNSVTSIGYIAFHGCTGLTSITIPSSVTSIGNNAFQSCTGLASITIPSSITSIGANVFYKCTGLTSITIPNSVTSITSGAFEDCSSLTSVTVERDTPEAISGSVFTNRANATLYVPAGAKAAYEAADYWKDFKEIKETGTPSPNTINVETAGTLSSLISDEDKYNITDLTITGELNGTDFRLLRAMAGNDYTGHPTEGKLQKLDLSGATIVAGGSYAEFEDNKCDLGDHRMASAYISEFIDNSLPECLFLGCSKLQEIKLPSSIVAIETGAFQYTGLTSFIVPKSTATLGTALFYGCDNLISLDVESGNTTYSAEDNAIIETSTKRLVGACKNTTIPNTVEIIGQNAFYNSGETIVLPQNLVKIERDAFFGTSLKSINIPASVSEIEGGAFATCADLIEITVDAGNTTYESPEGSNAIIEKSTKTLVAGCQTTVIPSDVTAIGAGAFLNNINKNSTSITLPASITSIGSEAFYSCSGLTSINLPASITLIDQNAFSYNRNLTVTVESTTPLSINENVFQGLSNSTLRVPAGCKSAYAEATGWSKFGADNIIEDNKVTLENVEAGHLADKISDELNITDLTITGQLNGTDFRLLRAMAGNDYTGHPTNGKLQKLDLSGVTIVEGGDTYFESDGIYRADGSKAAGRGSQSLSTGNNVVGPFLFAGCAQLSEVKIPTSTKEIGDWAFMMTNISTLDIPEGVEKMWASFSYNTRVSTITIPSSVTDIMASSWQINPYLSSIIVDPDNSKYDSRNNCNAIMETNTNTLVFGCKNTIIPEDTKIIGSYAFSGQIGESIILPQGLQKIKTQAFSSSSIKNIAIPASVSQIEGWAFLSCYNLAIITVDAANETYESPEGSNAIIEKSTKTLIAGCKSTIIPSGVKRIDDNVFNSCNSLTSITIPASIEYIGTVAFGYCHNLTSVTVEALEPAVIDEMAFYGSTNATLYVPAGSKTAYQAANYWKEFKEIVEVEASSGNIVFASPEVKAACVAKWDTNGDGELSYAEAAAVTSLVDPKDFEDPFALLTDVESDFTFDEFQYFTGVTSLTNYDFDEFEHLTSIVLPNSIQSIEGGAFYDCKLTSIHIPASVTDISDTYKNESVIEVLYTPAFSSSFLQTITVDPGNTRYSSPTGSNVIIDKTSNTLIMGCRNTDFSKIPNTVTTIAMRAFEGVEFANPAVNLPKSVEAIKAYAFNYSNIISINLGELTQLTEIGLTAFKECDGLTEVTLPASITTMERAIFAGCDNLVKVVSNREEPLANNNNNFDPDHIIAIYNNAVLYVPSGKVEAYTNAGWEEPFEDDLKSFRVITDGDHTDPEAIEGLAYNGSDQKLILPGTYRTGMMEYSLDGSTYSTSVPTGKEAGEYTVYYRKVGESVASTLQVTIALSGNIVFASDKVKAACVAKWDTDKDGELSYDEAAAVTSLVDKNDADDPFAQLWELGTGDSEFSFDEFQYFTGVTSLAGHEFECTNLTSIILPNSITSIGDGTFVLCKKLTSIHIPASVTYIHMGDKNLPAPAFNPEYLQTITVDPENTKYASPAGSNVIIDTETNTLILGCGNTDFTKVPNTVTTIGRDAFSGVTFANPIVSLPTSVTKIKRDAFRHSNITSINLGELSNLTTIGTQAFSYCTGLTEVTLPASIRPWRLNLNDDDEEGIETSVFANCYNIVKVVSNIEEPFNNDNHDNSLLYYYIFAIENDAVLYVPTGKVQAYIDKGWKEIDGDVQSFRVITDGDYTPPVAREGLVYGDYDIWMDPNKEGQRLIYPGAYRDGMMEYSLDGSTYSTSVPTGKEAGEYTVYYRKVGESDASILKVTIAAPKTISVFSGSNLWAGYVATENLAIPTGLEAYVITNLGATTATASSLNYIPQGVPVLLKRNNASVNDYEISTGSGTAPTVNLLRAYDYDKSVSNREGFILYNDEFVLVNEGTLPAGRVFLPANGSGRALTRTIVFDRDDIVDFGDSQENNDDSNQWYDIQGRKLERKPTKKGIYILDGRKVVIK